MTIPNYETLMLPVLKLFATGAKNVAECLPAIKQQFSITDEEAEELIPSGRVTVLQGRIHWARTYLSKAGLLASPKRNLHVITQLGKDVLAKNPSSIDNRFLDQFGSFAEWRKSAASEGETKSDQSTPVRIDDNQTPEDAMEAANKLLHSALRDELLGMLYDLSPQRFERVILDLLAAMGFGNGNHANGHVTKATGDGGIDGKCAS